MSVLVRFLLAVWNLVIGAAADGLQWLRRPGSKIKLVCAVLAFGCMVSGLTAYEKETQTLMGVPEEMQIRRQLPGLREDDSSDYLGIETVGPRELIVVYDAQNYVEHWNARPVSSALRMLRVRLED